MFDEVSRWLEGLGLGQYAASFDENAIGLDHLPDLDHEIPKEIGIRAAGHRITILKAAAELSESQATTRQKSWELRFVTSLARLWRSQSKSSQALGIIALVYESFTEGFDTADLREASELLEELS